MRRRTAKQLAVGPALVGGTVALVFGFAFGAVLLSGRMSPATFVWAGPKGPSYPIAYQDFHGEGAAASTGYDGQQNYAIAVEFPHISRAVPYLYTPHYRLMRILEPAIASLAPRGSPTVLALLGLNIVGAALSAGAVASLARQLGRPPGLGFLAAAAALPAVVLNTADALAFGLALVALVLSVRGRHGWAVVLFCLAGLTRETTILIPALVGLLELKRAPRQARGYLPYALPAVAVAAWYGLLALVVAPQATDSFELLGMCDLGPANLLFALAGLAIGAAGVYAWRQLPQVAAVAAMFSVWMFVQLPDMLTWDANPRVNYPAWAFGIAGVAWLVLSRRSVAGITPIDPLPPVSVPSSA